MTEVGKAIINSLEKDGGEWGEWEQTSCTIQNKTTGVQIWTENVPILNTYVYRPTNVPLSWHDKWCIYFAIKKRNATNLVNILETNQIKEK